MKDYTQAKKFYSKAIDLNPDFKSALLNRMIILWQEEEYEKALKDAKKVNELDNDYKGIQEEIKNFEQLIKER